jgi:hypothetical protein
MADKSLERRYLSHALEILGMRPEGVIESSETPDFLLRLAGYVVGIEVTAFYFPEPDLSQPQQARVSMQRIAVEQARRQFRAQGGPPLYVTMHFHSNRPLSKDRAYELGPLLARAVALTPIPASIDQLWSRVDHRDLPPALHSISIAASVNTTDELWHPSISGWVAPVESAHIEGEIARKAKRLATIREKCASAWLLIVNDSFHGGAMCKLSAAARAFQFGSPFDKTLWLKSPCIYDLCTPGNVARRWQNS